MGCVVATASAVAALEASEAWLPKTGTGWKGEVPLSWAPDAPVPTLDVMGGFRAEGPDGLRLRPRVATGVTGSGLSVGMSFALDATMAVGALSLCADRAAVKLKEAAADVVVPGVDADTLPKRDLLAPVP